MMIIRQPTHELMQRLSVTLRELIAGVGDGAMNAGFAPLQVWPLLLSEVGRGLSAAAPQETTALLRAMADEIEAGEDPSMVLRTARAADAVTCAAILHTTPPAGAA